MPARTQKHKSTKTRRGASTPDGQEPVMNMLPNTLLMNATSTLEKRAKKKQQQLQNRFKAQMKSVVKGIEERLKASSTNETSISGVRRRHLLVLAGLARDRAQIEQQIVRRLQTLTEAYETTSKALAWTLNAKVVGLQQ
ncbi:hypothetical protein AAP_02291 [Ascosphaera apis ARSEF 7405]|uniref:Uncharacterized protein n=1 Tax=Ascosphaera apis ARSEF 7405 TaxID=392613 RepID=A0A168A5T1_9EURO|nr:hypothetical protein AAP_02291 [Ascosphaera apis ARSEF 7405]